MAINAIYGIMDNDILIVQQITTDPPRVRELLDQAFAQISVICFKLEAEAQQPSGC